MRVECYGATRPQDGRSVNEDAFIIGRGDIPYAALCDGAGNANLAAKKTLRFFERLIAEATMVKLLTDNIWAGWIRLLDSNLLDSEQSTFVGVAVLGNQAVGAYAGDSRAYVVKKNGGCHLLTTQPSKARLGSGRASAIPIRLELEPRDILLLMSDGAWTPLGMPVLNRVVRQASLQHASDVPHAVLDAAGARGRIDDMTVVAISARA